MGWIQRASYCPYLPGRKGQQGQHQREDLQLVSSVLPFSPRQHDPSTDHRPRRYGSLERAEKVGLHLSVARLPEEAAEDTGSASKRGKVGCGHAATTAEWPTTSESRG